MPAPPDKRKRPGPAHKGRTGQRHSPRLIVAGALIVAIAVGLTGLFILGRPRLTWLADLKVPGLEPTPPYEQPLELRDQVARIDHALYGALFRLGLAPEDVHFERVRQVRIEGQGFFEQAQLRIELPPQVSIGAARSELARALRPLGDKIQLTWQPRPKARHEARLEIRWDGLLTHQLLLCPRPARRRAAPARLPRVALVMDDLGYDLAQARHLIALRKPITCSVLPFSPHAHGCLELASEAGLECLAHIPMEAEGLPVRKLGEGALLMNMDAAQLLRTLQDDLDDLPHVDGANNHMGSLLTTNEPRMKVILKELKRRGLLFLDSRTTGHSLGYPLAKRLGLKAAERDVFLDTVQEKGAILTQLAKLVSVARSRGEAVAICHPYPATFEALQEGLPQLEAKVRLVRLSDLAH